MVPAGDGIFEPALMPPQCSKALSPMSLPGLENFFHSPGLLCSSLSYFQVPLMRGKLLFIILRSVKELPPLFPLSPRAVCFCNYKQKE